MTTSYIPPGQDRAFPIRLMATTRASAPNMAPGLAQQVLDDGGFVLLISTREKSPVPRRDQHRLRVLTPGADLQQVCIDWPGIGNKCSVIVDGQPLYVGEAIHHPIKPPALPQLAAQARRALRLRIRDMTVICDTGYSAATRTALEAPLQHDHPPTCGSCGADVHQQPAEGEGLPCGH
jgi:hypothetical protein